ncbi:MAG: hypothetical protein R2765_02320 [Ferruginibacter sp.]
MPIKLLFTLKLWLSPSIAKLVLGNFRCSDALANKFPMPPSISTQLSAFVAPVL